MHAMPTETSIQIHRRRPRAQLKGRQPTDEARAEVRALIGAPPAEGHRRDLLIEHLHKLNDHYHGLFERHLVALAADMRLAMTEVYEVASFYHHFEVLRDDAVAPRLTVRVCQSLSCQMAGAEALLERLPALLGADVKLVAAACMGRCEQAPAALVGQRSLGSATAPGIAEMAAPASESSAPMPPAPECITYAAYRASGGYALAQSLARGERDGEGVIAALEHAGLRGLGGAGFPAGRKWRIVRDFARQAAERRAAPSEATAPSGGSATRKAVERGGALMAVNIDEGEPGTFKDRFYLERDPHRFLEGLAVAAHVVGCEAVYIYLRDEYPECRAILTQAMADLQAAPDLRDMLPKMELRRGAGAYICGEESAMIESIEGKRGEPRLRPPYIAEVGLFGRPTLEHNFETLFWVREILEKGPEWFAGHGRHGRSGLRSFSVSGRVKQPGVKLAPAGITLRELVDEYCGGMADGHDLYAYLPGGASGGILPARLADVPLDFDTLQPHGCFIGSAAIIVLGHHDKARDAALNMMRFFADESCGQCTPCRVGTVKAAELLQARDWDHATLDDLSTVMIDASICGLGQAAPNPVRCVQKYFPHEVGGQP
ncbi:MAG: NAD(P)H-dependent oxidoreductase subunit E [Burkholderiales bacterium]|nr:NAD(P)H-dependent oxidoreductase subunit E [Burkholderiales bacterium]MBK8664979.1 NAD(P)H-dependent oxidoreductase subunit E [Burkholderiales bacterium]